MKYLLYILLTFFIFYSCSENKLIQNEPTTELDSDKDGVSDEQEFFDNTDPNDPCSVKIENQYPPNVPETWKNLDCDGDGVTNQQEKNDGTDIINPCNYKAENQNTSIVSDEWKLLDCDEDAVTNEQELIDGTNPEDNCSFLVDSQTLTPSNFWLQLDCDGDGRTNEEEIHNNTNPTDPNDFPGSGDKIVKITTSDLTYFFIENGTKFDKVIRNSDNVLIKKYTYSTNGNLSSVFIKDDNGDITISYSYNNNQISTITRNQGANQTVLNITYNGNSISIYNNNDNLPNGLPSRKLNLNSNNKVASIETYFLNNTTIRYATETFEYDSSNENVIRIDKSINKGYNPNTMTLFDLPNYFFTGTHTFTYLENVKNPVSEATRNLYYNFILLPESFTYSWLNTYDAFSNTYRNNYNHNYNSTDGSGQFNLTYNVTSVQSNQYPTLGYYASVGITYNIDFYYEN